MINDHEKRNIAKAIRSHLDRSRLSREAFAFRTKLGKSTVDKLLIGLFSSRTLSIVEETLQIRFRHFDIVEAKADANLGGYLRSDVSMYEGSYCLIRPSFKDKKEILTFRMEIVWDDENSGLLLKQPGDSDRLQAGLISIPKVSFHLFVHSRDISGTRHLVLSRLDHEMKMRGLMLTLANIYANSYIPVSLPVVLAKVANESATTDRKWDSADPMYETYKQDLALAEEQGLLRQIRADAL